jgi:hypothetical protein
MQSVTMSRQSVPQRGTKRKARCPSSSIACSDRRTPWR